ncbi:MAG: substrate-binding domain-containing protein [Planctomycetes bacterium]|nr:substrate-binding domain-containing protein [Planctomycetota bacterium]
MKSSVLKTVSFFIALALALGLMVSLWRGIRTPGPERREVVIFLADSLDLAFRKMKEELEAMEPSVRIVLEPSASVIAARKVSSGRRADVLAVADHRVIDDLMPGHAAWRIDFASNELVLAGTQMSRFINEIDTSNWQEVLLRDEVRFGRADPNLDPCGYWTLLAWKLADRLRDDGGAGTAGPSSELLAKAPQNGPTMREDTQKLLALLEGTGGIDYAFVYRSQAVDHRLRIVDLPREIHLGDPALEEIYAGATVEIQGPGQKTRTVRGAAIVFAATVLRDARETEAAERLIRFLLGPDGRRILEESGFKPIVPPRLASLPAASIPDFGPLARPAQLPGPRPP